MLSCVSRCKTTYLILYRQKSVWLYRVTKEYKSKGQFSMSELPLGFMMDSLVRLTSSPYR